MEMNMRIWNQKLWLKFYNRHFPKHWKEIEMEKKNIHTGDEQDIHKLHTHPRLECTYGLGNTHVIIDYTEFVKAKEREHKDEPPFTATPEDHYKSRLIEQSKTIGELQVREKELSDEVMRLHLKLKPTSDDQYKFTKAELKHYKERYFQQVETIRDYQEETKKYKARLNNFDISMEAGRITIHEYRKEVEELKAKVQDGLGRFQETYYKARIEDLERQLKGDWEAKGTIALDKYASTVDFYQKKLKNYSTEVRRLANLMNTQACELATTETKSKDLEKLLEVSENQREYFQARGDLFKKHKATMSSTIEALKATVKETKGTTMTNEKAEAFEKEYCGNEEIRPLHADTRSDTFQFANFCPECNRITFTTKAFSEGQICSNCYAKCETPEEFTDAMPSTVANIYSQEELAKIFPYRGRCPKCKRDTYCPTHKLVDTECYECQTGRGKNAKSEVYNAVLNRKGENQNMEPCQNCGELVAAPKVANVKVLCAKCVETVDIAEDLIAKPNHYNWHPTGVECKDIVKEFIYNKGTAIAYIWRSEHKGTEEADLQKAVQHLQFELERIKEPKK